MGFVGWVALAGGLLLVSGLMSAWIHRLPLSHAIVYLVVGLAIGPWGIDLVRIDAVTAATGLERWTEVAVAFSLFVGGLKLRLPIRDPAWRAAYRLAGPVMVASIAGITLFGWAVLGLAPWLALLVGGCLAPTDPVLASDVSVERAQDRDRLRYGLSGEAGLNDGAAFPFVVLALAWHDHGALGGWLAGWVARDVLYAVVAGLVLGFAAGNGFGRLAIAVRSWHRDTRAPSDLLALALIAVTFAVAEWIHAYAFLAVFAAGVGLRRAELQVVRNTPHPDVDADDRRPHPPAEDLVGPTVAEEELDEPAVAAGVLVSETLTFGATAERLLEVVLVVGTGVALGYAWDARGLAIAAALFVVIRPAAAFVGLLGTPTTSPQRAMMAAFGVRGIGSLYYVAYAANHGLDPPDAQLVASLVFTVVAASIVVHGVTAQPALDAYTRTLRG
ncbi:MAG: cation:proton antiporter [Myxococcota bacterium]